MPGKKEFQQEIYEVLKALKKEKVRFYIVGGMALVLHGIPRTTLDIDIIIPSEKDIIIKFFDVMYRFNFHSQQKQILRIVDKPELLVGQWITFADEENREIFDVYFENSRKFEAFFKKCEKIKTKSIILDIASLKDIKNMKKESGRPIDFADITLIDEKMKR